MVGNAASKQDPYTVFTALNKDKKTMEETHRRQTFLLKRELAERLNNVAAKADRGFKTFLINQVLEQALDDIEKNI
jgi:hypothetical protein